MTDWAQRVAARFGRGAQSYDRAAGLQAEVAARLATLLPPRAARVLEVGCGTGLFTAHLRGAYPGAEIVPTDISPAMAARVDGARVMDGENPHAPGPFDLIAACMSAHWFANPLRGLQNLADTLPPGGVLLYAAPAPGALGQWRGHLDSLGLSVGLLEFPDLPFRIEDNTHRIVYKSGLDFLRSLRDTGAATPRPGHRPLNPGQLRRAARAFDVQAQDGVGWVIRYGRIGAL